MRHALPNVVEGKVLPVALFIGLLQVSGSTSALIGSLLFSFAALARRRLRREEVTGILILTTVGLLARTIAALATGSLLVYFLQPTITTALVALTFVASVLIGKPLAERLMADVCPVDDETRAHPHLRRFLSHLSLWWAFTSAVNFSITLWVLLNQSPTTFVLVKSILGPLTTTATLGVGFLWFRTVMARSGTQVVFAPAAARPGRQLRR
ncbi:MAG: DUF3159 domain-containing protein [Acidimicrobiia bacterium]|nr:DUF3159 domain-containing protein [Acidimicrobiia bacterium]